VPAADADADAGAATSDASAAPADAGTDTAGDVPSRRERPAKPGLRQAAAALQYPDFARLWWGALVSNTGTWIQSVTVPYVLYQITGSAAWVGFAAFAQFLPVVLMGPLAGSLADRFSRRRILLVSQAGLAAGAFALWVLWASGVRSPSVIVATISVIGVVAGLNIPAWQAFITELVPRSALLNAITLNSAQFNASRAFGPALGGLILATLGPGWAFLINAASFAAVIAALVAIRTPGVARPPSARPKVMREFVEAVRYSRARPGIWVSILAVVALGLFGGPMSSLVVVFAEDVFEVGQGMYGLLGACLGIGSVLFAPLVAGPGSGLRRGPLTAVVLVLYGLSVVLFGLAPSFWVGALALLLAGGGWLTLASALNTTIQLQVDESMRGKVIAIYLMGLTASIPVGALAQGWLIDLVGPRATVAGAGLLLVATSMLIGRGGRYARMDDPGPHDLTSAVPTAA
jgi:MFS family permease